LDIKSVSAHCLQLVLETDFALFNIRFVAPEMDAET